MNISRLRLFQRFCTKKIVGRFYADLGIVFEDEVCKDASDKALVLGVYYDHKDPNTLHKFTPATQKYNQKVHNKLEVMMKTSGTPPKLGEVRTFYGFDEEYFMVALAGLGKECQGYDVFEQMDEGKEAVRIAAAAGCREVQKTRATVVYVDSFGHSESAAEGAALGVWLYQEKKNKLKQIPIPQLELYDDCDWTGWQIGLQKAAAQNLARQLMDTPANCMTPTSFAQNAVEVLCKAGVNVEVKVRGWAETRNMFAFLAAGQGSCEPPIFLEISYYGTSREERPVILVGKGVTYNTGGLSLKRSKHQKYMRGDMAGAAIVVAACRAVAGLQLPLNIRGLIPLCENMPGCAAMRPGDIIKAMNNKAIEIEKTDCAGRLMLADALVYAQNFWPRFIVDVGTMTYGIERTFGPAASGVFSNSEVLWEYLLAASMHTGDRVWRLPLWEHYTKLVTRFDNVELRTHGRAGDSGSACKLAAFLREFVPCGDWLHIDAYGVMKTDGRDYSYLRKGMAGRPTRTIVEFLSQLVCYREDTSCD